jgi:starch synthase
MRIAFVTAECASFVKVGGLADVADALPAALRAAGHAVHVYLPYYTQAARNLVLAWDTQHFVAVTYRDTVYHCGLYHHVTADGVDVYFIRYDELFGRAGVYGVGDSGYPDNLLRFAVFQQAVLEALQIENWFPDILHLNDWHTAAMPAYLREYAARDARYGAMRTVFTIHNLAYQGIFDAQAFAQLNLPPAYLVPDWFEHYGGGNCMKCALLHADQLTTVSPTYAREIQGADGGCGFDGILRGRRAALTGILNGIDPARWNPAVDSLIPARYDAANIRAKAYCKKMLRARLGLEARAATPLCGFVARLTEQKGVDLLLGALDSLVAAGAQVAVLGTGNPQYEQALRDKAAWHAGAVAFVAAFDDELSHWIEAGADIFLMPSRFEPCGLNQMYSLAYGTLPVVHRTGGLADTVVDTNVVTLENETATGFVFDPPTVPAFLHAVHRALTLFHDDPATWRVLRRRTMTQDFSWPARVAQYLAVYQAAQP